jgi:hypothetical protein
VPGSNHPVEECEGDQVLGLLETEGHPVQHPQLGVRRLDQGVAQVVDHRGLDARKGSTTLATELDDQARPGRSSFAHRLPVRWPATSSMSTRSRLYVLFFIDLKRRKVFLAGVTEHPIGSWVTQRLAILQ